MESIDTDNDNIDTSGTGTDGAVVQNSDEEKQVPDEICEDSLDHPYEANEEHINMLAEGFLSHVLPDAEKSKASLDDLVKNQDILLETIHHENQKFDDCQAAQEMEALMAKTRAYYGKLLTIKKDMSVLHDRAGRLKKTALRFQQQKQREALMKEQQKEAALEREKQLIAKPAKKK